MAQALGPQRREAPRNRPHCVTTHANPTRGSQPAPDAPYAHAWRAYRRRNRLAWLLLIGYVPVLWLVALVAGTGEGRGDFIFGVTAIIWAAVWIVTSFRLGRFRCPRCKQDFFHKWPRQNGFARRCLHCGLRKWANGDHESSRAMPSSDRS